MRSKPSRHLRRAAERRPIPRLEQLERRDVPSAAFSLIHLDDLRNDANLPGIDGSGITVAVIDSGVAYSHPLLVPATIAAGNSKVGFDFSSQGLGALVRKVESGVNKVIVDGGSSSFTDPKDEVGHGTLVAGIIAARDSEVGVATASSVIGLKVADKYGDVQTPLVIAALKWVRDNAKAYNIRVVNMSVGSGSFLSPGSADPYAGLITDLESAGVTVVSAAGNDYGEYVTSTAGTQNRNAATPAVASTIAVGATFAETVSSPVSWGRNSQKQEVRDNTAGPGGIAAFSQRPAALATGVNGVMGNALFAPGTFITSTSIDHASGILTQKVSGTSFAAPIVAGVTALLQDAAMTYLGRYLTPAEARQILLDTAQTILDNPSDGSDGAREDATVPTTLSAYKLIDAHKAVIRVRDMAGGGSGADANSSLASAEIIGPFDRGRPIEVLRNLGTDGESGFVSPGGSDIDLYKFTVPVPATLTAAASAPPGAASTPDAVLRLFNSAGSPISLGSQQVSGFNLAPGTYFVGISSKGNSQYNPVDGSGAQQGASQGAYLLRLTLANPTSTGKFDPNGVLTGAVRVYPQLGQSTSVTEFLGADFPDYLPGKNPAADGYSAINPNGIIDIDITTNPLTGKKDYSKAASLSDVDMYILSAPSAGRLYIDIDSADFAANPSRPASADADTLVRAWRIPRNNDGSLNFSAPVRLFDAGLSTNDRGTNPYQSLDSFQNIPGNDPFFQVQVNEGDTIAFAVSGPRLGQFDPNTTEQRASTAPTRPGFYTATFGLASSDVDGRIGTDQYNLIGEQLPNLPSTSTKFSIGNDVLNGQEIPVGATDVDFFRFSSPLQQGLLSINATGRVANGANGVPFDPHISVFEVRNVFGTDGKPLLVPGTTTQARQTFKLIDSVADDSGARAKVEFSAEAGKTYYIAISSAGNTSYNPYQLASGFPSTTGEYDLSTKFSPGAVNIVLNDVIEVNNNSGGIVFFSTNSGVSNDIKRAQTALITFDEGVSAVSDFKVSVTPGTSDVGEVFRDLSFIIFEKSSNGTTAPIPIAQSNSQGIVGFRKFTGNQYYLVGVPKAIDPTIANPKVRYDDKLDCFIFIDPNHFRPADGLNCSAEFIRSVSRVGVAVSSTQVDEPAAGSTGSSITVSFTREDGDLTQALSARFNLGGSALKNTDYRLSMPSEIVLDGSGAGIVSFPSNQSTVTMTLTPLSDSVAESKETVSFNLMPFTASSPAVLKDSGSALISIADLPPPPPPQDPTINGPSDFGYYPGFGRPITGVALTLPNSSQMDKFQVEAVATAGRLTEGDGLVGKAALTFSGTIQEINSRLAKLTLIADAGYTGTDKSINFSVARESNPQATIRTKRVALKPAEGEVVPLNNPTGGKTLLVIGTSGSDNIKASKSGTVFSVQLNSGTKSFTGAEATAISSIAVYALDGDDTVDLTTGISIPTLSYGGKGNDIIQTGSGIDTIFGEEGADLLAGGLGADVIMGGAGKDILVDGLIAQKGTRTLRQSLNAYVALPPNASAAQYDSLASFITFTKDSASRDTLNGEGDLDLFFAALSTDIVGLAAGEKFRGA